MENEQNKLVVADNSLKKVEEYYEMENFGRAFAHYLVYLELMPDERSENELKFAEVLTSWCLQLEGRNKIEDLYKCYLKALVYFPVSPVMLTHFGEHLLRLKDHYEAKKYLTLAHQLDKNYLPAKKNLDSVKERLLPRWHFKMLNDTVRNKAYYDALNSAIDSKYNHVLDIGTGCGLLSLIAARNAATRKVVAVEESIALAEVAKEIFAANNVEVTLINKSSHSLKFDALDLPNLLVTEIFDCGFFGERVLKTLIHAHENLLDRDCSILPQRARVFIAGFECLKLYKRHRFINYNVGGLNLQGFNLVVQTDEPYDAQCARSREVKLITESKCFADVDFYNLEQLKKLYMDANYLEPLELQCTTDGALHGFIIWFDLFLNDTVKITTNPFDENNCKCWEQAIVFNDELETKQTGDLIKLQISCESDELKIDVLNQIKSLNPTYKTTKKTVLLLNDKYMASNMIDFVKKNNTPRLVVLDLYPIPLFSLLLAKNDAHVFTTSKDQELVKFICKRNQINIQNFTFMNSAELQKCLMVERSFDVIIFNPVGPNGTLNEMIYEKFHLLEIILKENGVMIPQKVVLDFIFIDSHHVDLNNRVHDTDLFGFRIAEYMNKYVISECWQMDRFASTSPSHSQFRIPIAGDAMEPNETSWPTKIIKNADAAAVLYWFDFILSDNVELKSIHCSFYHDFAAFIFEEILKLRAGESVQLTLKRHLGFLEIRCMDK